MITKEYILSIIPELVEFESSEIETHVQTAQGYDAVIALFENIRTVNFPAVIIENRTSGNILYDCGPLDNYSIPVWIMLQDNEKEPAEIYDDAFELMKKIIKILIRDTSLGLLPGLDYTHMSYNMRSATDAYGYELLLTFRTDIDLSL